MKQRYKVVKSNYDKETGISTVTIATPDGLFTAESRLLEEDKDIESSFAGCHNAEIKAHLKWLKYQFDIANAEYLALKKLDDELKSSRKFNQHTYEYKHVSVQLWRAREKRDKLATQVAYIEDNYLKIADYRNKIIRSKWFKGKDKQSN